MTSLQLDPQFVTHHVSVSFKYLKGSLGQATGVNNRHTLKLRILVPIFIEDQQQLLSTTQGKARHETLATPSDDVMYHLFELALSLVSVLMLFNAIGAFHD
jgi:hypothetical protein